MREIFGEGIKDFLWRFSKRKGKRRKTSEEGKYFLQRRRRTKKEKKENICSAIVKWDSNGVYINIVIFFVTNVNAAPFYFA